jgi:hypothetical protein
MAMRFSARRTVIPNPANRGGYAAYERPDPNEGQFGNPFLAGQPDKLGIGLASRADEYHRDADAAERERLRTASPRERGVFGSSNISSAPRDRKYDAFFQALQEQGVDRLAADAVTPGGSPSFFGDRFAHGDASPGAGTAAPPPGYTQRRAVEELQNYRAGGSAPGFAQTPGGQPAPLTPSHTKYIANILSGLKRAQSSRDVASARADYEAGKFEDERNARARYLDAQDAKRGRTNVRRQ